MAHYNGDITNFAFGDEPSHPKTDTSAPSRPAYRINTSTSAIKAGTKIQRVHTPYPSPRPTLSEPEDGEGEDEKPEVGECQSQESEEVDEQGDAQAEEIEPEAAKQGNEDVQDDDRKSNDDHEDELGSIQAVLPVPQAGHPSPLANRADIEAVTVSSQEPTEPAGLETHLPPQRPGSLGEDDAVSLPLDPRTGRPFELWNDAANTSFERDSFDEDTGRQAFRQYLPRPYPCLASTSRMSIQHLVHDNKVSNNQSSQLVAPKARYLNSSRASNGKDGKSGMIAASSERMPTATRYDQMVDDTVEDKGAVLDFLAR